MSPLPAHRWPWHWTYALVLEKRWDQIRELTALDDDENGVPPEYWHDTNRVEAWVEEMRRKRKEKYST